MRPSNHRMEEAAHLFYVDGLSYREIAAQMYIGTETVKTYLKRFREGNGIESRRDAVEFYRRQEVNA